MYLKQYFNFWVTKCTFQFTNCMEENHNLLPSSYFKLSIKHSGRPPWIEGRSRVLP